MRTYCGCTVLLSSRFSRTISVTSFAILRSMPSNISLGFSVVTRQSSSILTWFSRKSVTRLSLGLLRFLFGTMSKISKGMPWRRACRYSSVVILEYWSPNIPTYIVASLTLVISPLIRSPPLRSTSSAFIMYLSNSSAASIEISK